MSTPKINFEELKTYIPQNGNEENYALLTHYLMMRNGDAKNAKRIELLQKFNFEEEKLNSAENFFSNKNLTFVASQDSFFSFIDLFAGIGGFRLAMQANGGECVFSSEWDKSAKQTYYANYGEVPFGDITKIDPRSIPDFDVLAGGFPCQPFSSIGKREGFKHKTQSFNHI